MSDYVLSLAAEQDLVDIADYIAAESMDKSDRFVARLFDAFEKLARRPGIGHKREDLTDFPVLFWPVGSYLVIYRIKQKTIQIVAIVHGKRDIPAFLTQERFSK